MRRLMRSTVYLKHGDTPMQNTLHDTSAHPSEDRLGRWRTAFLALTICALSALVTFTPSYVMAAEDK